MKIPSFSWRGGWRQRLWRWRWWIAVIVAALAVRAALPGVLRRVLVAQASEALHARVEVGDVDLFLLRGGVALEDVVVRPAGAAVPDPAPDAAATAASDDVPIVAFERFAVELRYLPLFAHAIRLRAVELDTPRVALDRLASGELNVMALVPRGEEGEVPAASPTPGGAATPGGAPDGTPWNVGIDRFVLRDGRLRFRDLAMEGSEPVEVGIDRVAVEEIALSPGLYGEPGRVHVSLGVDDGSLDLDARLQLREGGVALTCDVTAQRLPVRRVRLYVPRVGWSDLRGELDLAVTYELETGVKHQVRGTASLRDVAVTVPQREDVVLAWTRLGVDVETVDLLAQRAAVSTVTLDGARVHMHAEGEKPLPVLTALAGAGGPDEAVPEPAAEEADATEPARPWEWRVASVRVADSVVHVLSDQPPLDAGVDLTATNLAGAAGAVGHVAVGLAVGEGMLRIDGDVRVASPAFGGTVQIRDLSLPPLVAVSRALPPEAFSSATLRADLAVEAGLPTRTGETAPAGILRATGRIGVSDARLSPPGLGKLNVEATALDVELTELAVPGIIPVGKAGAADAAVRMAATVELQAPRVALADAKEFSVAAQAVRIPLSELVLPGVFATAGAPVEPVRAAFGEIRVEEPAIRVTRSADGMVLPAAESPAPSPAPASEPVPGARGPLVDVRVEALRIAKGRVDFTDRAVQPVFHTRFAPIEIEARDVRYPDLAAKPLRIDVTSAEQGRVRVDGTLGPEGGAVDVTVKDLVLAPFNPYATTYSPYGIRDGALSIASRATLAGDRYDATNAVTLHQLALSGTEGESLFQQQFGIPLSLALALLRDVNGDIALDVPVRVDRSGGTRVDLLGIVRGAVVQAIMGAIQSPLKLLGAVTGVGAGGSIAPAPIAFRTGRPALTPAGRENAERLARFLAGRPAMAVRLEAAVTTDDVRWLREQALRAEWEEEGFLASLASLPQRGTRDNIRRALAARADDEPGELSAEDAAALQRWLDGRPPPAAGQLFELATARLAAVEAVMQEHGIDPARISRAEPAGDAVEGAPVVRIEFRPVAVSGATGRGQIPSPAMLAGEPRRRVCDADPSGEKLGVSGQGQTSTQWERQPSLAAGRAPARRRASCRGPDRHGGLSLPSWGFLAAG